MPHRLGRLFERRELPAHHGQALGPPSRSLPLVIVAIDGPAGAGKSTVARAVADALGFLLLDSGAMYRATALALLEHGGPAAERAAELDIELGDRVLMGGRDVTRAIRAAKVSAAASKVATDPEVRAALVQKQRTLLESGDWVAEGRDIGTVVAPEAEVKVFLFASPEERAKRRAQELGADPGTVLRDMVLRDAQDEGRAASPLRPAIDATALDTTGKPVDDVVSEIVSLVRAATPAAS